MRNYYVFKFKEEYVNLYYDYPSSLFHILSSLYSLNPKNSSYGFTMFNQLVDKIEKEELDRKIYVKYHREVSYSKQKNEHIINNFYHDEISVLTVKNSYILINTNRNTSSFFKILSNYSRNYFACDFINHDYFWIKDIKMLV